MINWCFSRIFAVEAKQKSFTSTTSSASSTRLSPGARPCHVGAPYDFQPQQLRGQRFLQAQDELCGMGRMGSIYPGRAARFLWSDRRGIMGRHGGWSACPTRRLLCASALREYPNAGHSRSCDRFPFTAVRTSVFGCNPRKPITGISRASEYSREW